MNDAPDEVGRLYVTLGRINRAIRRESSEAPVGHGALSALATLTQQGPLRLGTLAVQEGVSPPSMTRIVTSLEGLGHVRRTPDPEDGRAALVEATASGRALVLAGRESRLNALRLRVERLPDEQRALLSGVLPVLESLASLDG